MNGGSDVVFSATSILQPLGALEGRALFRQRGAGSCGRATPGSNLIAKATTRTSLHVVEIADEGFFFQAINRKGVTVDAGSLRALLGHGGPPVICCTLFVKARNIGDWDAVNPSSLSIDRSARWRRAR